MAANPASIPSPLRLEIRNASEGTVVVCRGRLISDSADLLKAEVKRLIPRSRRIVLDLTALSHMDSAGLGAVVSIYVACRSAHCGLELVNLNKQVRQLLGLTKVLSLFEACGEYMIRMP